MPGAIGPVRNARGYTIVELTITLLIFAVIMAGVIGTWSKAQEAYFVGSETAEIQQNARAAIDFMVREIRSAGRDTTQCAIDYSAASTFVGQDCDAAKAASCLAEIGSPYTTCAGVHGIPCAGSGCATHPSASRLVIRADRNDNGTVWGTGAPFVTTGNEESENVDYEILTGGACGAGVACITRTQGGGGAQAMVGVDIDTSQTKFVYFPRRGYGPCATTPAGTPCPAFDPGPADQSDADNIGRIRIQVKAVQMVAGEAISRTMVTDVILRNRN